MAAKRVTIHDIAKKLNTTASTVSRALNNHPKISDEMIAGVRKTAREMGYKPNILASNLRNGKTKTIGLIVPRINRYFIADVIAGIESITFPLGYNLIICQSDESLLKEKENIKTLINNRVEGILISLSIETTTPFHLQNIVDEGIPLVQFDRTIAEIPSGLALNDNFGAARQAVHHLAAQGYTKIAHFAGNLNQEIYRSRLAGYQKALDDLGLNRNASWVFYNTILYEPGVEAAHQICAMNDRPDAVFSAGDLSAMGAHATFRENGLNIPRDIGLCGFANEPFTQFVSPGITSINQFGSLLGKAAAEVLFEIIASGSPKITPMPRRIITPELIVRQSTTK